MGFFDRFKKNKENSFDSEPQVTKAPQSPYDIEYSFTSDGKLQVEFYNHDADFRKFYDTTRLVVGRPIQIGKHQVCSCSVSWYGENDCQMLDEKTGEYDYLRARDYKDVLVEIDLELLQTDPNYCNMLMNGLLDKQRVERYLAQGLQEEPQQPCGNYIGGVRKIDKSYQKFFSVDVGQMVHSSPLMINRRQKLRDAVEAQKAREIADKKAQIAKLQKEVDDMQK